MRVKFLDSIMRSLFSLEDEELKKESTKTLHILIKNIGAMCVLEVSINCRINNGSKNSIDKNGNNNRNKNSNDNSASRNPPIATIADANHLKMYLSVHLLRVLLNQFMPFLS